MDRSPQSAAAAGRGGGPFDSTVIDRCAGGGSVWMGWGSTVVGGCRRLGRFFFLTLQGGSRRTE